MYRSRDLNTKLVSSLNLEGNAQTDRRTDKLSEFGAFVKKHFILWSRVSANLYSLWYIHYTAACPSDLLLLMSKTADIFPLDLLQKVTGDGLQYNFWGTICATTLVSIEKLISSAYTKKKIKKKWF